MCKLISPSLFYLTFARHSNLRNSLLIVSRASFGRSFNLLGMCLSRPFMRPLVEVHTGMGQQLLPFFLWAFIKQGLQTRVSDPMSDSERPSKKAKFFVFTALEESTVLLQTLHWWGPDFTAKKNKECFSPLYFFKGLVFWWKWYYTHYSTYSHHTVIYKYIFFEKLIQICHSVFYFFPNSFFFIYEPNYYNSP